MMHVVWDWNGTLFHDIRAVVEATNEVFRPHGVPPLSVDGLRAVYTRPIWTMYERILGRPLDAGEWEHFNTAYHMAYERTMRSCTLTCGAVELLTGWRAAGRTQSLLSMWRHDRLVAKAAEFGIDGLFSRIDGLADGMPDGGEKAEHLVRHLAALGLPAEQVMMIGDSVDDAAAAGAVGARAVLFTGGSHSRRELERTGVPVVDSLADALDHAC